MDVCEGESCWAEGWLQHSFTLSASLASEAAAYGGAFGPLTTHLDASSFPTRVVPVSSTAIGLTVLGAALILTHEIYVSYSGKPLRANHEEAASNWVQISFLFAWFVPFFMTAMVVPISLDFALQMGESATMSGFFVSSPIIGSIVGIIVGKMQINEADWNQSKCRRLMIGCGLTTSLLTIVVASIAMNAGSYDIGRKRTTFWIIVGLLQVLTVVGSVPTVPFLIMQAKLTPTSEKTFWMILAQCARNGGMLVGPGFFALVSYLVKRDSEVSPASLLAWVYIGNNFLNLSVIMYNSLHLPAQLGRLPEDDASAPETEICVTKLPAEHREKVVKNMVLYSLERPFSIAAVEVGTIMLLEVSYGWSNELCGVAFTVVSGASLIFSAFSGMLLSRSLINESTVFFAANSMGLFGVLFLFDFGTGAAGLLIADALVYGMASVANGIAEGWASKAAMPNTSFSLEIYRLQNTIAVNCSRFLSPIVARTLLDYGGRNVYASMQLLIVFLGTLTVYKTVKLVWDQDSENCDAPVKEKATAYNAS